MGFIEPIFVLAFFLGIYAAAVSLSSKTKDRILWWSVAVILAIGAAGVGANLLRHGTLTVPAFQD